MTELSVWLLVVLAFGLGAFAYGQFVLVPRARRLEGSGSGDGKADGRRENRRSK
jgi:hypothetical protein